MNRRRIVALGAALAATAVSVTTLAPPAAVAAPTTLVVSNPVPISPPDGVPTGATSQIAVSGQTGLVTDVDVTFNGFTSTYPQDLDVLLIGPNGRSVMLMSDACSSNDVANLSLRFDDEAAAPLRPVGPCVSGSYFPYNADDDEPTPGTAPALSAFDGASPNGTWTLLAIDQSGTDVSTLTGGFTLTLQVSDEVGPTVTFGKKPKPSTNPNPKVSFTADDAGSTFECNLDGVGWNPCKSPAKLKRLDVGKHKLSVRATDPSGNLGAPAKTKVTVLPRT